MSINNIIINFFCKMKIQPISYQNFKKLKFRNIIKRIILYFILVLLKWKNLEELWIP